MGLAFVPVGFGFSSASKSVSHQMCPAKPRFQTQMSVASPTPSKIVVLKSGEECVRTFYAGWNARDFDTAGQCISPNTVYEDAIFDKPFYGREETVSFFRRISGMLPPGIEFVVDHVADGGNKVGVMWHCEINKKPLPFSRGNSFYVLDDEFRILEAFETPESFLKNGQLVLNLLGLVSPLLMKLPMPGQAGQK